MYFYVNDKVVHEKKAVVSVLDRGFLFGDGVFETMRSYDGKIFKLQEHMDRLNQSASFVGISIPKSPEKLHSAIHETLAANKLRNAYIRITVTRGPGALGIDPTFSLTPTLVIIVRELLAYSEDHYAEGVDLMIPQTRRNHILALNPLIKSANYLNNILAKTEAVKSSCFDALMLNMEDLITECTVSNFFFCKDGVLHTPAEKCGILSGITRATVIDLARLQGVEIVEGFYHPVDVYKADEAFVTNSIMEVMPVRRVDDVCYRIGDTTRMLARAYAECASEHLS